MVQLLLRRVLLLAAVVPVIAAPKPKTRAAVAVPALEMDGGRKLLFERVFHSEGDVRVKRGFWTKLVAVVTGEPEYHDVIRPYGIATDSRGRIIVTDPAASGIHIFDFAQQKFKFISHLEGKDRLRAPQCVAVDRQDNIYVTDSEAGKIFMFNTSGKFQRVIGGLRGGEGFFKRPTGIAVDSEAQRIYVSDTWRNRIFVLDMQGAVIQTIGKNGVGDGEFNYPTELRLSHDSLIVVDAMNFRVQVLTRQGGFRYSIGTGQLFRPKGVAVDSEDHIYVADGYDDLVRVFDEQGRLLYYFGAQGMGPELFRSPAGVCIDSSDRIFVADSGNRRMQVFHYFGVPPQVSGGER